MFALTELHIFKLTGIIDFSTDVAEKIEEAAIWAHERGKKARCCGDRNFLAK